MFDQVSAHINEELKNIVNACDEVELHSFLAKFESHVGTKLTFDRRYGKDSLFLYIKGMGITYWPSMDPVMVKVIEFLNKKYPIT